MTADRSPTHRHRATVGIDLGGTGTRLITVDEDGAILYRASFPTDSTEPGHALRSLMAAVTSAVTAAASFDAVVTGVGIGASGPITNDGIIDNAATLPAFTGLDLRSAVRDELGLPCLIDNDAAAAAVGEYAAGAGQGSSTCATVTLGTGIGVGIVAAGRLVRASDGTHPEAGHITIPDAPRPCYCGLLHCWEQAASRTALEHLVGADLARAATAARAGDAATVRAFEHYGRQVGAGLSTLATLYRPDRIVLGGSAAQYVDLYAAAVTAALGRAAPYQWSPPIVPARLGDLAGAVGAAHLARRQDTP